jgi:DNA-directed RNA polymerase subunit K/omega
MNLEQICPKETEEEVRELVPTEERRFSNIMSKFEIAAILAARANDLAHYPQQLRTKNESGSFNPIELACKEFEERKVRMAIFRPVTTTGRKIFERWTTEELIVNPKYIREALQLICDRSILTHKSDLSVDLGRLSGSSFRS